MDENIQWLIKRAGFISASNLPDLMCKGRGKDWGDTAISYLRKVEYERMMGYYELNSQLGRFIRHRLGNIQAG